MPAGVMHPEATAHGQGPEVEVEWLGDALALCLPAVPPDPPQVDTPEGLIEPGGMVDVALRELGARLVSVQPEDGADATMIGLPLGEISSGSAFSPPGGELEAACPPDQQLRSLVDPGLL